MASYRTYSLLCLSIVSLLSLSAEEMKAAPAQPAVPASPPAATPPTSPMADQIKQLQSQIDQLKKQGSSEALTQSLKALSAKIDAAQAQLSQMSSQPSISDTVQPIKKDVEQTQAKIATIQQKVDAAPTTSDVDRLTTQVKEIRGQIEALKKEQREAKERAVVLKSTGKRGDSGIYGFGEYLLWKLDESGTEFAVESDLAGLVAGNLVNGEEKKFDFDWESGYRVGAGYDFPFDGWDICGIYTHLSTKESERDNTTSSPGRSVYPLLMYQNAGIGNAGQAHASWHVHFSNADVELGRDFLVSRRLSFRPLIGWKWAWIDQKMHVDYSGGGNSNLPAGSIYQIRGKNDFRGNGIKLGTSSNWELGGGFGFFGTLTAALLNGHFTVKQTQIQTPTSLTSFSSPFTFIDLDTDVRRFVPMTQFQLGVIWNHSFWHESCHLGLSAAYENQYWWRQNQLARFTQNIFPSYVKTAEDLSMHGLTVQARLDF